MRALRNLMLIAAAGLAIAACGKSGADTLSTIDPSESGYALGSATAPVTMIEYASTSCSHCAKFNNETFPAFKAKYIDTGQVRYVLREITTPPADFASASFLMARCAGPEKYHAVIDAVFRSQGAIFQSGDLGGGLRQIALSAGMTEEQFKTCVTDEKAIDALNKRVEANSRDGQIDSTPTFFFNGVRAKGELPMERLDELVAAAKAAKK